MTREFICIICPNGCEITAHVEDGRIVNIDGNICQKGRDYVEQELTCPKRTIASSVAVRGGVLPLVSVRLDAPVPRKRIFDVMAQIRAIHLDAPVRIGDVAIENVLGLGSNVVVTKNVEKYA